MDLETLRRRKEEAERTRREAWEAESRAWKVRHTQEEEEKARIQAEKSAAEAYYLESDFPELIEELRDLSLYAEGISGGFRGADQALTIFTGQEGYSSGGYTPLVEIPVGPNSRYRFEVFRGATDSGLGSLLSRFFPTDSQKYTYRGFVIEATPQGEIIAYGAEKHVLPLGTWKGNLTLQKQVLEQLYINPFIVRDWFHKFSGYRADGPIGGT